MENCNPRSNGAREEEATLTLLNDDQARMTAWRDVRKNVTNFRKNETPKAVFFCVDWGANQTHQRLRFQELPSDKRHGHTAFCNIQEVITR